MIKNSSPFLLAMRNLLIRFEIPRNTKHKEYYGEENLNQIPSYDS